VGFVVWVWCTAQGSEDLLVKVSLEFKCRTILPRWMLSIDPHLVLKGANFQILRLDRSWKSVEVDLTECESLEVYVIPSAKIPDRLRKRRLLLSPHFGRQISPGDCANLRLVYRPFPISAYLIPGWISLKCRD
jgi:hypothetical protein